jgi:hypothetical protein
MLKIYFSLIIVARDIKLERKKIIIRMTENGEGKFCASCKRKKRRFKRGTFL